MDDGCLIISHTTIMKEIGSFCIECASLNNVKYNF